MYTTPPLLLRARLTMPVLAGGWFARWLLSRRACWRTAPSHGLMLHSFQYSEDGPASRRQRPRRRAATARVSLGTPVLDFDTRLVCSDSVD